MNQLGSGRNNETHNIRGAVQVTKARTLAFDESLQVIRQAVFVFLFFSFSFFASFLLFRYCRVLLFLSGPEE